GKATSRCRSIRRACTAGGCARTGAGARPSSGTNRPPDLGSTPARVSPNCAPLPGYADSAPKEGSHGDGGEMTAIGTHSISWGDTLSQIAQRYGTSIDALQALNPQITNPDLIYAGDTLRLSGAGAGGAEQGVATAVGAGAVEGRPLALDGANAAAIAEQFIGRNAGELKHSNELPMQSWVPDNVNCANFVSACLQKAGLITSSQASASVDQLANNLRGAGWQPTSLANARP